MSDNEYEEENLDDFMISASSILCEDSNSEKETVIETLKQHLSQNFHDQNEMKNIFKILQDVIFTPNFNTEDSKTQKITNKQPFKLYPVIYSFNPKTSYYYLDFFLESLQKCACEENRSDFTYLSIIFAEVVTVFFTEDKNNKNLIKNNAFLDPNKKVKLFEKILNFCNDNIKTNQKLEQSFGCLLLSEFIEKCPLVKEDKYLENIFKIISDYLDDRWFECKLDLLNCTISLIFTAETKFKPYANICLFRVLDYLTDTEWMKRKLAINIVYTLVFYCKEEILAVKENIIDFLNMLKEDPVDEVKEVCLQTLKFIEENDPANEENKNNSIKSNTRKNENEKPRNVFNKNKNKSNKSNDNINNNNIKNNNKSSSGNKKKNNEEFAEKLQKEKEFLENLEKSSNNSNIKDSFGNAINGILQQLQKIQEDQNHFFNIVNNIQQTVDNNFTTLNERVMNLEKKAGIKSNINIKSNSDNNASPFNSNSNNLYNEEKGNEIKSFNSINNNQNMNKNKKIKVLSKKEEQNKIDELKRKFVNGKYNEVLIESKENDNYLFKLLPFMDKNIIPKIEIVILEDIINRLNKKISIICLGTGRGNINDILSFYIQLTKSKVNLKLMTQLSIKDTLKFLKAKSNNKLIQNDINNIDAILKALKV